METAELALLAPHVHGCTAAGYANMGLMAAQQLGFDSIVVQALNSRSLLQVCTGAILMPDFLQMSTPIHAFSST